jgi:hypothetical protein
MRPYLGVVAHLIPAGCVLGALVLLAGCTATSGDTSRNAVLALGLREPHTMDLLYVGSYVGRSVLVYDYHTRELVQTLTGFTDPAGLCADAAGNVYVTDGYAYDIVEYHHGATKPFRYLADPNGFPWSCAVNPVNGDLAVANGVSLSDGKYGILIYKKARGVPKLYTDSAVPFYFDCAYDPHGNVFFDGESEGDNQALEGELTAAGKKFINLALEPNVEFAGGIAWWHDRLAIADPESGDILRYRIAGSAGKLSGRTRFEEAPSVGAFFIDGNTVIGADYDDNDVGAWPFPKGGGARYTLGVETPQGVVVSFGARR